MPWSTLLAGETCQRAVPVASKAHAPPPRAPRRPRKPGARRPELGSEGHLTDALAAPNLRLPVDDGHLRPKSSAWMSYPQRSTTR